MSNYTPTAADLQEWADWADEQERLRDPNDEIRCALLDAEESRYRAITLAAGQRLDMTDADLLDALEAAQCTAFASLLRSLSIGAVAVVIASGGLPAGGRSVTHTNSSFPAMPSGRPSGTD